MKKLTHSAAARAAAFILCLLCGLTALLCAAGYYMTQIDRDRTLPEPDSVSVYQNGIRVLLNNALQEERYTGEYPALPSGYSYVATDTSTGKVLYDGRTKNAVPLGISAGYFSEGVGIDVQAYLEPKQTPGEELTLLRTSVGTLLRYQNAYLPAGIITAVLCHRAPRLPHGVHGQNAGRREAARHPPRAARSLSRRGAGGGGSPGKLLFRLVGN